MSMPDVYEHMESYIRGVEFLSRIIDKLLPGWSRFNFIIFALCVIAKIIFEIRKLWLDNWKGLVLTKEDNLKSVTFPKRHPFLPTDIHCAVLANGPT
jgi:hypothetical protein